ncbi:MAG: LysR family transcriptional regulator [Elioraea sp.]|nr:LysR family transcriptional regulator [Elioraea sp.]
MSSTLPAPIRLFLRLELGKNVAIGPGKADPLQAIGETGLISAAARRLGMGGKRAWLLVETMNAGFRGPLVHASRGGDGAGGARLTTKGAAVRAAYRALEKDAAQPAALHVQAIARLARPALARP